MWSETTCFMALNLLCCQQLQETTSFFFFFSKSSYEHAETYKRKKKNRSGSRWCCTSEHNLISAGSLCDLKQIRDREKHIFTPPSICLLKQFLNLLGHLCCAGCARGSANLFLLHRKPCGAVCALLARIPPVSKPQGEKRKAYQMDFMLQLCFCRALWRFFLLLNAHHTIVGTFRSSDSYLVILQCGVTPLHCLCSSQQLQKLNKQAWVDVYNTQHL